jgi:hypothetical protein
VAVGFFASGHAGHAPQRKYFGVRFEDLFEVVLVNPETGQEQVLERRS